MRIGINAHSFSESTAQQNKEYSVIIFFHNFFKNLGADDDPEPERHPCPDFFDTCCSLRQHFYLVPSSRPDMGGVRNKNGLVFSIIERENEAQFGEFLMKLQYECRT